MTRPDELEKSLKQGGASQSGVNNGKYNHSKDGVLLKV